MVYKREVSLSVRDGKIEMRRMIGKITEKKREL